MSICHDLCIGAKHSNISRPKHNSETTIVSEGKSMSHKELMNQFYVGNTTLVLFGVTGKNATYTFLPRIAAGCMEELDNFIEKELNFHL